MGPPSPPQGSCFRYKRPVGLVKLPSPIHGVCGRYEAAVSDNFVRGAIQAGKFVGIGSPFLGKPSPFLGKAPSPLGEALALHGAGPSLLRATLALPWAGPPFLGRRPYFFGRPLPFRGRSRPRFAPTSPAVGRRSSSRCSILLRRASNGRLAMPGIVPGNQPGGGSISPAGPRRPSSLRSPLLDIEVDCQRVIHLDRAAVFRCGLEEPLACRLDRCRPEVCIGGVMNVQGPDAALLVDDPIENDPSHALRLPHAFRVVGADAVDGLRRRHSGSR